MKDAFPPPSFGDDVFGPPDIHELPDGSRLMTPQRKRGPSLHRGDWVRVDGEPWRIADLQTTRGADGRVVHLEGRRRPVTLTGDATLPVYTVMPAPHRATSRHR